MEESQESESSESEENESLTKNSKENEALSALKSRPMDIVSRKSKSSDDASREESTSLEDDPRQDSKSSDGDLEQMLSPVSSSSMTELRGSLYTSGESDEGNTKNEQQELMERALEISLTRSESIYLASALEDTICQMVILGNCNKDLICRTLRQVREMEEGQAVRSREGEGLHDTLAVVSDTHKLAKMNSDREYITQAFINLYLDLKRNGTFVSLAVQMDDVISKNYQGIALELEHNDSTRKLQELQAQLAKETREHKQRLEECELIIHKLRNEIDDSAWNSDIKTRYVQKWENSKREQSSLSIQNTEKLRLDTLDHTEIRIKEEALIHEAIKQFIKEQTEDLSEQIEMWMKRYDEESEQLDIDIRVMEEKNEDIVEKTEELQKKYDQRQFEIDSWLTLKRERAERQEREAHLQRSAIRIQAWWRGVSLRRRLAAKGSKGKSKKKNKKTKSKKKNSAKMKKK